MKCMVPAASMNRASSHFEMGLVMMCILDRKRSKQRQVAGSMATRRRYWGHSRLCFYGVFKYFTSRIFHPFAHLFVQVVILDMDNAPQLIEYAITTSQIRRSQKYPIPVDVRPKIFELLHLIWIHF